MLKNLFLAITMLGIGAVVGGGGGYLSQLAFPTSSRTLTAPEAEKSTATFVSIPPLVAPLVLKDGRLSGYASFEIKLEVEKGSEDFVAERLPFLQHAVNLRSFKAPLATGADGMLPDIDQFRRMVTESADEAIGKGKVYRVAITKAEPV